MKRLLALLSVVAVGAMSTGAAEACSASGAVDTAKKSRSTDQYKSARDVAEEFVDEEGFTRDEITYEAGAGTLLLERGQRMAMGRTVPNDGRETSDWKSMLDDVSSVGHGRSRDGADRGDLATVREHMWLHVWEWDYALKGHNPTLLNSLNENGAAPALPTKTVRPRASAPAPLPLGSPASAPIPAATPAPAPAAAAAPLPAIHRAG